MTMDNKTPLEMLCQWKSESPEAVFQRQPKALQWLEYTGHVSVPLCRGRPAFEPQGAL